MPAFVCLVWTVFLIWSTFRTDFFLHLLMLIVFATTFLYADSIHSDPRSVYGIEAVTVLISQISAPSLVPFALAYLRKIGSGRHPYLIEFMLILVPSLLFTVGLMLHIFSGSEAVRDFHERIAVDHASAVESVKGTVLYSYYISTQIVYRIVLFIQVLILFVLLFVFQRRSRVKLHEIYCFLFKGGSIRVYNLQVFNLMMILLVFSAKYLLFKEFINTHGTLMVFIAILLTIVVSLFCATAMLGMKDRVTLEDYWHGFRYNYSSAGKSEYAEFLVNGHIGDMNPDGLRRIQDRLGEIMSVSEWRAKVQDEGAPHVDDLVMSATVDSWKDERLLTGFQKLMSEEQLFLQPGLTLVEVSERLNSNKTYVSRLVNNAYGQSFPELMNILRVDYAEQYIMTHIDAKQDVIARACGFLSASSFNNTFKRVTGMTPKVWAAGMMRSERANK